MKDEFVGEDGEIQEVVAMAEVRDGDGALEEMVAMAEVRDGDGALDRAATVAALVSEGITTEVQFLLRALEGRAALAAAMAVPPAWVAALERAARRRRLLVRRWGSAAAVFTAPHSIGVKRDGQPDHLFEPWTRPLSCALGELAGGCAVAWSEAECNRVRRDGPDGTNRDPNHLLDEERSGNPWFEAMSELRRAMPDGPSLHCDLHGCADRRGDCIVGLGAMASKDPARALAFGEALESEVGPLIRGIVGDGGDGMTFCISIEGPFCGRLAPGRSTLTELSVTMLSFSHAAQFELSRRLRGEVLPYAVCAGAGASPAPTVHLNRTANDRLRFAEGIVAALQVAVEPSQVPRSPPHRP